MQAYLICAYFRSGEKLRFHKNHYFEMIFLLSSCLSCHLWISHPIVYQDLDRLSRKKMFYSSQTADLALYYSSSQVFWSQLWSKCPLWYTFGAWSLNFWRFHVTKNTKIDSLWIDNNTQIKQSWYLVDENWFRFKIRNETETQNYHI